MDKISQTIPQAQAKPSVVRSGDSSEAAKQNPVVLTDE
jgi:hypothetical protein